MHQPLVSEVSEVSDRSIEPVLENIDIPLDELIAFCQSRPIRKLYLFGSVLRTDFTPKSDVDVLVEFTPGASVTYFDLAAMQRDLGRIVGRRVDLGTPNSLSPYIRQQVLDAAKVIYEQTR